jgi:hypothetical protein
VVLTVLEALEGANASALTGVPSSIGGAVRFTPPSLDEHGALIRHAGWAAFSSALPRSKNRAET